MKLTNSLKMHLAATNKVPDATRAHADAQALQVAHRSMGESLAEFNGLKASAAHASAIHGKCR